MAFEKHFVEQLKMHPSMQYQDVIKLCYQAAFGAEHLLSDTQRAKAYLFLEFEQISATDEPLFEMISDVVCRVNLGAWKKDGRSLELLFEVFAKSCAVEKNANLLFDSYLNDAECIMRDNIRSFEVDKWRVFLNKYKENGNLPIHHSEIYRNCERPAYRIVKISELEKVL